MRVHETKWLCLAALLCCGALAVGQPSQPQPHPEQSQKADAPSPSPMDAVNNELPSWLRFSGQLRARVEGYTGGSFKPNHADAYVLTRLWLNMKIQPTSWLKFFFQGMDAHAPWKSALPAGAPYRDTMDLRQAYVELGDTEKSPLGFRLGRQEPAFGEQRLVGSAPWLNTARSFDGVHGSVNGKGFRVDAFAVSVVKINQGQFDENIPGNNFYGLYSSFSKLVPKATVEPYFFWRRQSGLKTESKAPGILNFGTVGFRWVGKLPASFDYGTEIATQNGSLGSESLGAWAGHWLVGYTVAKARFAPRVFAEYNYASGGSNPTDNKGGTSVSSTRRATTSTAWRIRWAGRTLSTRAAEWNASSRRSGLLPAATAPTGWPTGMMRSTAGPVQCWPALRPAQQGVTWDRNWTG
jgi:hypothetical protein